MQSRPECSPDLELLERVVDPAPGGEKERVVASKIGSGRLEPRSYFKYAFRSRIVAQVAFGPSELEPESSSRWGELECLREGAA